MRSHAGAWERAESRRADGGLPYGQLVPTLLRGNALKDAPASRADGASYGVRKRKTWQGGRQAGRDAGASVYAFPRRSVGTSREPTSRWGPALWATRSHALAWERLEGRSRVPCRWSVLWREKAKTLQGWRQAGRDAGASVYAFPRRSVGTSREPTSRWGPALWATRSHALAWERLEGRSRVPCRWSVLWREKAKTLQGWRQAGRDAGASVYAFPRRSVGTSRGSGGLPIGNSFPRSCVGKSRKYGHLDSGSTLHFPVKKFPEKTESSYFIDTRVIYRFARNDDCRDDSL